MKGDSVCWREDWKALKPDMSCDTRKERERTKERKRPIEFFYQVALFHVKYLCACVHAHVCIPSVCVRERERHCEKERENLKGKMIQ